MTFIRFDHIYGIIEVIGKIKIKNIILNDYYADKSGYLIDLLRQKAKENDVDITYVKNEESINFASGNFIFYTPYERNDIIGNNNASIMCLAEFYDKNFLFLGDCEKSEERYLLENYAGDIGDVDLLKVAHHGSKTSSDAEFISELSPLCSVISVGRKNRFYHPDKNVVKRLKAFSDIVLMTSESGEIDIFIEDDELKYRTYFYE